MDADEIFVFENGRVSERGTHHELLQNVNSLYYRLWTTQNHSAKDNIEFFDQTNKQQKMV